MLRHSATITNATLFGATNKPGIAGKPLNSRDLRWDNFEAGIIPPTREFAGSANTTFDGSVSIESHRIFDGAANASFGGSLELHGGIVAFDGTANASFDGNVELNGQTKEFGASANVSFDGAVTSFVSQKLFSGNSAAIFGGSVSMEVGDFSFKWSIDNLEARTDYGFPTVYVDIDKNTLPQGTFPQGEFYDRRLTQMPRLAETELDTRFGISGFQRVTFTVDNSDRLISGLDLQDSFVRMFFVDDQGSVYKEFNGKVVDWTLSHQVTINVEDIDALALTQDLPKRTLNDLIEAERAVLTGTPLTEFNAAVAANDLGKPIPIIFGRAIKVPLLYVKADEDSLAPTFREYDYIIGEGAGLNGKFFQEVTRVYRNEQALDNLSGTAAAGSTSSLTLQTPLHERPDAWFENFWIFITSGAASGDVKRVTDHTGDVITPDSDFSASVSGATYELREWQFYDGSQTSPYAGYAFIRFRKRMGESGRTDPLYADVNGLEDEVNVVNAIESVLSNSNWGFGLTVDISSFNTAHDLPNITPMKCEGGVLGTTSASDLLRELLGFRDMTLSKADNIEIAVDQAKTSSLNLGLGDETGYHNILEESPAIEYIHPDEKVKNLKVRYRKNHKENDAYLHEFERSSSTNGIDTTINLPFVYEHATADRVLDYKRKRFAAADRRLSLNVGQDAIAAVRGDLVTMNIPSLGVSSDWEITGTNVTPAGSQSLSLVPYSALPYTYVSFTSEGGTLPVDESFDIPPDFAGSFPEPISGLSVSMLMDTVGTNAFPYAKLTWTAPTDGNYSGAVVSVKLNSEGTSEYRASGTYDASARIDGLTPGQLYDFKVESLNVTGEHKGLAATDTNNLAGGDSTPPNDPSGLTGAAKFGRLIWTFTKSTSNDVLYHEAQVYTALSGGTLLYATKLFSEDEARVEFERQTGDLTSGGLTGYCQVRAVDYSGNASSYTSRVVATTEEVARDDLEDNATMNIDHSVTNAEKPGGFQSNGVWYTVLSTSITTDRTTLIKVRYNGQWVDTGDGFELRLRRNSSTLKTLADISAVQHGDATINDVRSISAGTHTYEVQTRNNGVGGTGLGLINNSLSVQGNFK